MGKTVLIGVTGSPASGKSLFSSQLSKATGIAAIEINSVLNKTGSFSSVWKDGTKVADLKHLERALKHEIGGRDAILVGHLAQELSLPYDVVIVVRARIGILFSRMRKRGYGREKVNENLISEATDYCGSVARRSCSNVIEVETQQEKHAAIAAIKSGRRIPARLREEKDKLPEFAAFIRAHRKLGL